MNKTWFQTLPGILLFAAFVTKVRDAFKFEVPVGYQDETGFHTGVKRADTGESFPPVW
jgi:hypothetical protein